MQSLTRPARHVALLNRAGAARLKFNALTRLTSTTSQAASSPTAPEKSFKPPGTAALLAWATAFGIAFYSSQLCVAALKPCKNPHISDLAQQTDVAARYDDTADRFDYEVGFSEWLMGITKMRRKLARQCKGHVLEVSCGTGRNLGYFDLYDQGGVDSLTFVDLSTQMIKICKKKWVALYTGKESILKQGLVVRFLPASALDKLPLAPAADGPKKYDTIIQTMGLCSTPNPEDLIANMVQHLDTSNPDARIFLLEHGRSYKEWLNNALDNSAQKHAEVHGCWFNRDIGAIVSEAAQRCGLVLVRERRHHLGTTWEVELKPAKVTVPEPPAAQTTEQNGQSGSKMQWVKGLFSKTPEVVPPKT